jgi:hypothetical protein
MQLSVYSKLQKELVGKEAPTTKGDENDGNMNNMVKVGFCIAYDWNFLRYALPLVYDAADSICISIDGDRRTWANKPFQFDDRRFCELIRATDVSNKIDVYEDDFHVAALTSAQNEVRQRRLMAERMGEGGWHVQLDCDEYFLDFTGFVEYLKAFPRRQYPFNVCCQLVTLFKKVDEGFLYVYPTLSKHFEFLQVASRMPLYDDGRRNGSFNVHAPFLIIHQSWARNGAAIVQKMSNWGHKDDFDSEEYFKFWQRVDKNNFKNIRSLHPIQPDAWPGLAFIQGADVDELIARFRPADFPSPDPVSRFLKNSRFVSAMVERFRRLYDRFFKRYGK